MTIDQLFQEANEITEKHPGNMLPVLQMRGPGFFPGCIGTIKKDIPLQNLSIMVVGQDFDTLENHQKIKDLEVGEIKNNTTWSNLKVLLDEIEIDPEQCFFTNAYMGLRPNIPNTAKTTNIGTSPAAKKNAKDFASACQKFFKAQLEAIKPKLVLVMGKETAKFITKAFPDEAFKHWRKISKLETFYKKGSIAADLRFNDSTTRFLFVIHPCLNGPNRSRIWKGNYNCEEQKMLREKMREYFPAV